MPSKEIYIYMREASSGQTTIFLRHIDLDI